MTIDLVAMAMNMFVLLVIFFHISGNVDHSVCHANTIVRSRGRGRDSTLHIHVDSDLHVSILGSGF